MAETLPTHVNPKSSRRLQRIILWCVQIVASCLFLMAGLSSLIGMREMVGLFYAIGYGEELRYFTGFVQVVGAIMLLMPKKAALGALILSITMFVALCVHLFLIGGDPSSALLLFVFAGIIAWVRRDAILSRLPGARFKKKSELRETALN